MTWYSFYYTISNAKAFWSQVFLKRQQVGTHASTCARKLNRGMFPLLAQFVGMPNYLPLMGAAITRSVYDLFPELPMTLLFERNCPQRLLNCPYIIPQIGFTSLLLP